MVDQQDVQQKNKASMDLVTKIIEDAKKDGKSWSWCWHNEFDGDTVVVVVENPERRSPHGVAMVPGFYVAKIHNGSLISETFV